MGYILVDYDTLVAQTRDLTGLRVFYTVDDKGGFTVKALHSSLVEPLICQGQAAPASFASDFPVAVVVTALNF